MMTDISDTLTSVQINTESIESIKISRISSNVNCIFDYRSKIPFLHVEIVRVCNLFIHKIFLFESASDTVWLHLTLDSMDLKFELNSYNSKNIHHHKIKFLTYRMMWLVWSFHELYLHWLTHCRNIDDFRQTKLTTWAYSYRPISMYLWLGIDNTEIYWDVMYQSDIRIKIFLTWHGYREVIVLDRIL